VLRGSRICAVLVREEILLEKTTSKAGEINETNRDETRDEDNLARGARDEGWSIQVPTVGWPSVVVPCGCVVLTNKLVSNRRQVVRNSQATRVGQPRCRESDRKVFGGRQKRKKKISATDKGAGVGWAWEGVSLLRRLQWRVDRWRWMEMDGPPFDPT
jgi:hypothetical protein